MTEEGKGKRRKWVERLVLTAVITLGVGAFGGMALWVSSGSDEYPAFPVLLRNESPSDAWLNLSVVQGNHRPTGMDRWELVYDHIVTESAWRVAAKSERAASVRLHVGDEYRLDAWGELAGLQWGWRQAHARAYMIQGSAAGLEVVMASDGRVTLHLLPPTT
jgi:hypothetical protein